MNKLITAMLALSLVLFVGCGGGEEGGGDLQGSVRSRSGQTYWFRVRTDHLHTASEVQLSDQAAGVQEPLGQNHRFGR